jgi:[ribosomal protein S5]-alanine N-acetyltransferase
MSRDARLVGPRVVLRTLVPDDFTAWSDVRRRSRPWLEPWEPLPEPGTIDPATDRAAFRARCGSWDRQRQLDAAYGFGIFLVDGTLVGELSLGSVQRAAFQSAFVGYWIDHAYAGHGLVPEAMALILRFAFDDLGLHRVEAAIVPRNAASVRVAQKLGLREEGLAERFLQIAGVWEDHVRYAITAEEWEVRRTEIEEQFLHRRG